MPIFQELCNMDQQFRQLSVVPIVINDLVSTTAEDRKNIERLLLTRYSGDMVTLLPSCDCGATKGEYSYKVVCRSCNTMVKPAIEDEIEPNVWYRSPAGVAPLISPIILIMLMNRFQKSRFNIMSWIMDTDYRPAIKEPAVVRTLVQLGITRGYNNFYTNFDAIMDKLFKIRDFREKGRDRLKELIDTNRERIFSQYLPIPNKALLVVEEINSRTYVDPIIVDAKDAILMLVSIDENMKDFPPRVVENRTVRAMIRLANFYESFMKNSLSPKLGQFRRHIAGSRTNHSFRCVITSRTDPHNYNTILAPWGVGLSAFRDHLIQKLMTKQGMTLNSAIGLLHGHISKYHPLLDHYLKELIAESPGGRGIPVILGRNPSLLQGSLLLTSIERFKTDPEDQSISLSILAVRSLNADFDGKALPSL